MRPLPFYLFQTQITEFPFFSSNGLCLPQSIRNRLVFFFCFFFLFRFFLFSIQLTNLSRSIFLPLSSHDAVKNIFMAAQSFLF